MNLLNILNSNIRNNIESKTKQNLEPSIVETVILNTESQDHDSRYERLLAILKISNPKMHAKIINMD